MSIILKGNTSQNGTPTPSVPQIIHTVNGNNTITISNSDSLQSTSYPINLGDIELCKIGDYQDRIFKAQTGDNFYDTLDSATQATLDTGSWYKYGAIGKVVINGSEETWGYNSSYKIAILSNYNWEYAPKTGISCLTEQMCTHFKGISDTWTTYRNATTTNGMFKMQSTSYRLSFRNTALTSLQDWTTWLSTNKPTIYYVLQTPTYDKITDSTLLGQLNTLSNARSMNEQTNINQENNDNASIMSAVALEEM